ncbi:MAG: S41 family peptidase [Candidatus Colwellbacteria bacterium]|nr:S41 family peptidase [Candidatus Colwellbacteria bacterium]
MKQYLKNFKNKGPLLGGLVVVVIVLAAVSLGSYYLGFRNGVEEPRKVVVENIAGANLPDEFSADFGIFWETWDKLRETYIDKEDLGDQQKLVYGAVKGMVDSLGDPNTSFFTPEESKQFSQDLSGSFGGIGAEIGSENEQITIIAPLKSSPSERAGLRANDKILKVDGKSTEGLAVSEAVRLIRGEVGTKVTLTIIREGWQSPRDVEIARETIQVPTVEWSMKEGNIIHLELSSFSANTPFAFFQAIAGGLRQGGDGLILDLRNNPGGFLEVSVNLAGWFVNRGDVVVSEKFTGGDERLFRAYGNEALKNFPVVVIMNEGSASASEILAGALRVHQGIKIVGAKSFGKGTVQQLIDLSDGSTLKVTISHWLLPNGHLIEGNGLEPDVKVLVTDEDLVAGRDPQLDKAIEVLKQEMQRK